MKEALRQAQCALDAGEVPVGAVVVFEGRVVGRGFNRNLRDLDPTAHAEVIAIREACKKLADFELKDCELYTSCEPCPMCLGAIYWARPARVYFANTAEDASRIGFDDSLIYKEAARPHSQRKIPMIPLMRDQALEAFRAWEEKGDKTRY